MSFFKPLTEPSANKSISRLHKVIWVLIYAGLLTVTLGVFVQRGDDAIGFFMMIFGGLLTVAGFVLIYVRSTMKVD